MFYECFVFAGMLAVIHKYISTMTDRLSLVWFVLCKDTFIGTEIVILVQIHSEIKCSKLYTKLTIKDLLNFTVQTN